MADIGSFQPLFPEEGVRGPLLEIASTLVDECLKLAGQAGSALLLPLRPQLRAMNSYYTNKIEGQHTHPADIERALHQQFDADEALARKQRIAIAHMDVEEELETLMAGRDAREAFSPAFVADIHSRFYSKLRESDRIGDDGAFIVPGAWRERDVVVGRHKAPAPSEIDGLLDAWARRYREISGRDSLLVGVACAHHRLAWIHPFIDGNGRSARLHSHILFHAMGLTQGMWSPMRGLARSQEAYYARLNNADLPRRNDYDGRGALSQEELVKFARYFLEVCLDQVRFMRDRLDLSTLKERLLALLRHLQANPWKIGSESSVVKEEALIPLHYIAITGPLDRSIFLQMTRLEDKTSRRVLASLIDYGILAADTHRSPVRFAVPQKALRHLFPNLWPEAEIG